MIIKINDHHVVVEFNDQNHILLRLYNCQRIILLYDGEYLYFWFPF